MGDSSGRPGVVGPLLKSKLRIPGARPVLVRRSRLMARLEQGAKRKLTLVSAPAGFGKTTLLANWAGDTTTGGHPAAWVSLDQGDNNPAIFWSYVASALGTARPGFGQHALALLDSPQPPPIEWVVTSVVNELTAMRGDLALILDDYHVIDAQPVHSAVAFLLDHLPPQVRLINRHPF